MRGIFFNVVSLQNLWMDTPKKNYYSIWYRCACPSGNTKGSYYASYPFLILSGLPEKDGRADVWACYYRLYMKSNSTDWSICCSRSNPIKKKGCPLKEHPLTLLCLNALIHLPVPNPAVHPVFEDSHWPIARMRHQYLYHGYDVSVHLPCWPPNTP